MLEQSQGYIIDNVENLLIELASDRHLSTDELNERTHEIIKIVLSEEEKNNLIQKIEIRDEMNDEFSPYKVMIKQILNKSQHEEQDLI